LGLLHSITTRGIALTKRMISGMMKPLLPVIQGGLPGICSCEQSNCLTNPTIDSESIKEVKSEKSLLCQLIQGILKYL
jgi:hypothetical protein